jgi:hypothetical protein
MRKRLGLPVAMRLAPRLIQKIISNAIKTTAAIE